MKRRGGEFSTGTMGNFQPELTTSPTSANWSNFLPLLSHFPFGGQCAFIDG